MSRQQANKEKVAQMRTISGANQRDAQDFLRMAEWDLPVALDLFFSSGRGGNGVDFKAISKLFDKYKDPNGDAIQAEGVSQFCDDLGVESDDVVMLVISWHFQAEVMCEFSRKEFENGMASLGCDSIEKLHNKLPSLRKELKDHAAFRAIYNFAYVFSRERGIKCVPQDVCIALWRLLIQPLQWPLIGDWCEFLEKDHNQAISRDTWLQLLPFIENVNPDFREYDETASWPHLFDDFVDYMCKKRGKS